jgi:hypothetical protein
MQVPETDVTWTYSFLSATESKAAARTGTPMGAMAELVGVDGSNSGGLMPFPGFREMYRFTPDLALSSTLPLGFTGANQNVAGTTAHKCKVVDFWSFSVIAGTSTRVWGFVYIVRRANVGSCNDVYDLMMDYNAPNSGSTSPVWTTIVLVQGMTDGGILSNAGKAVMSVETTGKAVYVFRRGSAPLAVYFKFASSSSTPATVILSAGPGIRPLSKMYVDTTGSEVDLTGSPSSTIGHRLTSFPDPTNASFAPGNVVFSRVTETATPSTVAGSSVFNLATASTNQAGSYSLAVQFEDSRSGRKSQLSANVDMTFTGADRRIIIDGVYDTLRFDTLNIYRSVRTSNAGGAFAGGILQLDASVALTPYHVTNLPMNTLDVQPTYTNAAKFRYAYQLKDAALVMQDVFLDKPSYSTTMPKGGAGALLDGTMLVGNISENASDLTGTGETRWSASGVDSPELFTALGEYKPNSVGDAVTCFKRTGQVMAGLTRNGVQFFNKVSGYVRVLAAHQGYGITGPYAAATVGPVTYYLNYRGLKAVYPDGRLDDVQSINQLVSSEWYADTTGAQELSKVSMAFDPATLCLYILNPTRQAVVQMWFATGVVSELYDTSFGKVTSGWYEDTDGQLVPRALFLFNSPYPDGVTNPNFRPAVFMPSRTYNDKQYPETNITTQVSMLDANAVRNPATFVPDDATVGEITYYDNTCTLQSLDTIMWPNLFDTTLATNYRLIGMWVYRPSGGSFLRSRIIDITTTEVRVANDDAGSWQEQFVILDPVYLRVMPAALKMTEDKVEDFVVKQPTSLGVVLTDIAYTNGANLRPVTESWVASIYRENEEMPVLTARPTNSDGTSVVHAMIRGDSPNWAGFGKHGILGQWLFPCVETFIANVRFRLVGLQVKGRMLPTDRTRRTY